MRLSQAWTIALHDLVLLRTRRSVYVGLVLFPIMVAVIFPLLTRYILETATHMYPSELTSLLDAFSFWFAVGGSVLPGSIASYSIAGEKIEKSLEPLLATPSTDSEILLGKVLSAFLPTLLAIWGGAGLYMVLMDRVTGGYLGYLYYPNWEMAILLLVLSPLICLVSIEISVIISSWVTDVRSAQQISSMTFLPFVLIYVMGEAGVIPLDNPHLLEISGILAVLSLLLFSVSRKTFHREEILTRWR